MISRLVTSCAFTVLAVACGDDPDLLIEFDRPQGDGCLWDAEFCYTDKGEADCVLYEVFRADTDTTKKLVGWTISVDVKIDIRFKSSVCALVQCQSITMDFADRDNLPDEFEVMLGPIISTTCPDQSCGGIEVCQL